VANLGCPYCGGGAGSGLTAHDPNSCKMKPTGFDTGSELMGYQSALAVSDADPSADVDAMLEKLRTEVQTHRADEDFIAPDDGFNIAGPEGIIPRDLQVGADAVLASFGMKDRRSGRLLEETVNSLGLNRDTKLVPADEAAEAVSKALNWSEEGKASSQAFVDQVRNGEVVLTGSEIAILEGVRDEIIVIQNPDLAPSVGDGGWVNPTEHRHCTLCGQFVGELGTHPCGAGQVDEARGVRTYIHETLGERKRGDAKVSYTILKEDGTTQEIDVKVGKFKDLTGVSIEEQQDLILGDHYAHSIIGSYIEKPMFGEPRLVLPQPLRDAYLARPFSSDATMVVALIDPPFEKHEIEHLVETLPAREVGSMLRIPRSRQDILEVIANAPSTAGSQLAYQGALPHSTVNAMANSGDPLVRKQAVSAPNLAEEDLERLATDPSRDVRKSVLFGSWRSGEGGWDGHDPQALAATLWEQQNHIVRDPYERYGYGMIRDNYENNSSRRLGLLYTSPIAANPKLLATFVNDPDENIALSALALTPYARQAVNALGRVTSRKRLKAIHDALPQLWKPVEESVVDHPLWNRLGLTPQQGTEMIASVQEAIRVRL